MCALSIPLDTELHSAVLPDLERFHVIKEYPLIKLIVYKSRVFLSVCFLLLLLFRVMDARVSTIPLSNASTRLRILR